MTHAFKAALLVAATITLCATHPAAHAYVQAKAVTLVAQNDFPRDRLGDEEQAYSLHFGSRPADIIVSSDAYRSGLAWITQTLDVTTAFKLSAPGEVITQTTFANGVPPSQNPFSPETGNDFYLAGMVVSGILEPGQPLLPATDAIPYPHEQRFGWAHVHIGQFGQASVVDSAMAYGEGGIIVGTTQAVPEPATGALSLVGLCALLWRTQHRRQHQKG